MNVWPKKKWLLATDYKEDVYLEKRHGNGFVLLRVQNVPQECYSCILEEHQGRRKAGKRLCLPHLESSWVDVVVWALEFQDLVSGA